MNPKRGCVETIFAGAVGLSGPDREAYLARTCGNDAALRERVEKLLRALDRAGDFLTQPEPVAAGARPPAAISAAENATVTQPLTEKAGDRIGRYILLQPIGEGGCGVVYVAEQEEPVRRRFALKVIKLGMDTRSVIARFEAERQALALMDHPNIAKVLDAGTTGPDTRGSVLPDGPKAPEDWRSPRPGGPSQPHSPNTLPAGRPYFVMEGGVEAGRGRSP